VTSGTFVRFLGDEQGGADRILYPLPARAFQPLPIAFFVVAPDVKATHGLKAKKAVQSAIARMQAKARA
jgi:hypothetical protein